MHDTHAATGLHPLLGADQNPAGATSVAAIFAATGRLESALLHPNFHLSSALARGSTVIVWSGSLASHEDPHAGLFEPDIGTWTKPGWAALSATCARLAPLLAAHDLHLWIRPHPAHIISDGPSMLKFLREVVPGARGHEAHSPEPRLAVLPDPAMLLTPAMLPLADDHLDRLFAYIEAVLAISNTGLVVSSVAPPPPQPAAQVGHEPGRFLVPCPADRSAITRPQLTRRIESLGIQPARLFCADEAH